MYAIAYYNNILVYSVVFVPARRDRTVLSHEKKQYLSEPEEVSEIKPKAVCMTTLS